ncbi:hypothetical protein T492DRAFT_1057250 [Pavlovales sp. CCMP2436]|nr:hypothetical protein T492DRAFT_1057250 [Pavlovales sp. CCMP2436]
MQIYADPRRAMAGRRGGRGGWLRLGAGPLLEEREAYPEGESRQGLYLDWGLSGERPPGNSRASGRRGPRVPRKLSRLFRGGGSRERPQEPARAPFSGPACRLGARLQGAERPQDAGNLARGRARKLRAVNGHAATPSKPALCMHISHAWV